MAKPKCISTVLWNAIKNDEKAIATYCNGNADRLREFLAASKEEQEDVLPAVKTVAPAYDAEKAKPCPAPSKQVVAVAHAPVSRPSVPTYSGNAVVYHPARKVEPVKSGWGWLAKAAAVVGTVATLGIGALVSYVSDKTAQAPKQYIPSKPAVVRQYDRKESAYVAPVKTAVPVPAYRATATREISDVVEDNSGPSEVSSVVSADRSYAHPQSGEVQVGVGKRKTAKELKAEAEARDRVAKAERMESAKKQHEYGLKVHPDNRKVDARFNDASGNPVIREVKGCYTDKDGHVMHGYINSKGETVMLKPSGQWYGADGKLIAETYGPRSGVPVSGEMTVEYNDRPGQVSTLKGTRRN